MEPTRSPDLEGISIGHRLAHLERAYADLSEANSRLLARHKRSRRRSNRLTLGAVALGALAVAAFRPPAPTQEVIRAGRFQLVDPSGAVQAELMLGDAGPGLFLYDAQGLPRASLSHDDEGTALYLLDDSGQIRVGAAQYAHGGGGFALHGPEAKGAAVLYLKGEGTLTFYDPDGGVIERVPGT